MWQLDRVAAAAAAAAAAAGGKNRAGRAAARARVEAAEELLSETGDQTPAKTNQRTVKPCCPREQMRCAKHGIGDETRGKLILTQEPSGTLLHCLGCSTA